MFKKTIIVIITFFLITSARDLKSHRVNSNEIENQNRVKILILSKYLRLIRQKKIKEISITLPEETTIEDISGGKFYHGDLIKIYYENGWRIKIADIQLKDNFNIRVLNNEDIKQQNFFYLKVNQQKRKYPLPLVMKSTEKDPELIVEESPHQYAMDSALAEYGYRNKLESEAVTALGHIILARFFYTRERDKKLVGKNYHFSDLTYSQVYRGRMFNSDTNPLEDIWQVDWKTLKENLYFHSSCGGKLYSTAVFNLNKKFNQKRDRLYRFNKTLCVTKDSYWQRSLYEKQLKKVFNLKGKIKRVTYKKATLTLTTDYQTIKYAVENFRLKLNRIYGWNFIKSNNFKLFYDREKKEYTFKGYGLGHNVGLCQKGALTLSRRGYNRYEIIKHYYPEINFIMDDNLKSISPFSLTPNISYIIFNTDDGKIIKSSHSSVTERIFPPGSLWKIIVALYLASERPDLFNDYTYDCTGKSRDKNMPPRCWTTKGHGENNLQHGLAKSCNLYFASLYKKISYDDFKEFYNRLRDKLNIRFNLPLVKNQKEWTHLLSGMDFRISLTTENIIKLCSYIKSDNRGESKNRIDISSDHKQNIVKALEKTFTIGTGKNPLKRYGSPINYSHLLDNPEEIIAINKMETLWGKTSTMVDGTNRPVSYGMFMGGYKNNGIIVFLKDGNGHVASQLAKYLLWKEESHQQK